MLRICLPALLVMASCQFGSAEQEVEILPEDSLSLLPSDPQVLNAALLTEGQKGHNLPEAQIGDWVGTDGQPVAAAFKERLALEQERAEDAVALAAQADQARLQAETDLLTLQAALAHERGQRVELQQERNFLLDRISEFEATLERFFETQLLSETLAERIAGLEVELYESKIYHPPLGELSLEDALRATRVAMSKLAEEQLDVEWFDTPEGAGVRISDEVIFGSGQVELDPDGVELLRVLARQLNGFVAAGATLQVIGHTDDQPLAAQLHRFPLGNLQLSSQRALVVADLLIEVGLPAESMSVAGYGSWQPLVSNETAEGRARNRRVELILKVPEGIPLATGPLEVEQLVDSQ